MTPQQEIDIVDRHVKGINLRLLWALVTCTALTVATVLSVYYGLKTQMAIQQIEIKMLEKRIERLENNK